VISAEMMLVKIFERARWLQQHGDKEVVLDDTLSLFLFNLLEGSLKNHLNLFCQLDDTDVISAIKAWSLHKDKILSLLCLSVLNRKLFKLKLQAEPIAAGIYAQKKAEISQLMKISEEDASFLVFTGEAENSLYNPYNERINILFRDGTIKDISLVDNALIHQNLSQPVKKFYICYYRGE
jgi:hypothetical protein